jgi:hypothetical protein
MGSNCSRMNVYIYSIDEFKNDIKKMTVNDKKSFNKVRCLANVLGLDSIHDELYKLGYIRNGNLCTDSGPFNVFAKYASGSLKNPVRQDMLYNHQNEFMICHNRQADYDNWNNPSQPGAMAGSDKNGPGHVFLTTKDLSWHKFNVLTLGYADDDLEFLLRMKEAANIYSTHRGWDNVGYYFHCYPHNTVQSLHLHIVNLNTVGPHFRNMSYKNLSLEDVISELSDY